MQLVHICHCRLFLSGKSVGYTEGLLRGTWAVGQFHALVPIVKLLNEGGNSMEACLLSLIFFHRIHYIAVIFAMDTCLDNIAVIAVFLVFFVCGILCLLFSVYYYCKGRLGENSILIAIACILLFTSVMGTGGLCFVH